MLPLPLVPDVFSDPSDDRREELCRQLAENIYDLGALTFTRELVVCDETYVVRVERL